MCFRNREGDLKGQSTEARPSHSYCILQPYILTVKQACVARFPAATTSLELSEKEGIMVFGNPIKISTATMEDVYERLCWIHATVRSTVTLVSDGIGCFADSLEAKGRPRHRLESGLSESR